MKKYERTISQWKELARRYFEAETTEAEEEALARFLATPAAQGKEFDELRAVMGYAATGRALYGRRRTRGSGRSHRTDHCLAVDGKCRCMCGLHQRTALYRQGSGAFRSPEVDRKGESPLFRRNSSESVVGYIPDAGRGRNGID